MNRKAGHFRIKKIIPLLMSVVMMMSTVPAIAAENKESSKRTSENAIILGKEGISFEKGKTYIVPVTLKNSANLSQDSVAKACFGKYAELTVSEEGKASLKAELRSVTVGSATDYAENFKIYQEAKAGGETVPAQVLSEQTVTAANGSEEKIKTVPKEIGIDIPKADEAEDGIYLNMYVEAMGNTPDAYMKIDYANAKLTGDASLNYQKNASGEVDQFGKYKVNANVTVTNGQISDVELGGSDFSGSKVSENEAYLAKAINGTSKLKGMKSKLIGLYDTDADAINDLDVVSGATYSSNAIKEAVMNALGIELKQEVIPEAPEAVPAAGTYTIDMKDATSVVDHSLVGGKDEKKQTALLKVDKDGNMSLIYKFISNTKEEPLYVLGFNGYYKDGALTKSGVKYVTEKSGDYNVVTNIEMPLAGDKPSQFYNTNTYLYVPAMGSLNETLSGIDFDHGKFNIGSKITLYWDTLQKTDDRSFLEDGTYAVTGKMLKANQSETSMADAAVTHALKLTVKDGAYHLTLNFKGLTIGNLYGYLGKLQYYHTGYTKDKYGNPVGTLSDVSVKSVQKYKDSSVVKDSMGENYPDIVTLPVIPEALEDGYVPMQVFVPLMESISKGNGTQNVYLHLDWTSLKKTSDNDAVFNSEDVVADKPAVTPAVKAPQTPASVKAARYSYDKVKLTWKKASDASGYEIYQYNPKTKNYNKVSTVGGTSYIRSGLATGTKYTFKVRAYKKASGKTVYGNYSKTASAKPYLSAAAGVKAKNSSKKTAKVTWKKVSGASGYVIYRATKSKGKYKAVKTVTKGSTLKYYNKKLKKKKKYFYKVRAYRKVSGKKVYAGYSKAASVKIKK